MSDKMLVDPFYVKEILWIKMYICLFTMLQASCEITF